MFSIVYFVNLRLKRDDIRLLQYTAQEEEISINLLFLFVLQRKSQRFYPTRLAINLASGLSSESRLTTTDSSKEGYLVIETNYRVYAYTGI